MLTESKKNSLLEALRASETGLTRPELQRRIGLREASPRHFLRLLAPLLASGLIRREGTKRGARYLLAADAAPLAQGGLSLSRSGASLEKRLRRPRHERAPVGYRREFLDAYEPGKTWYLDAPLREKLLRAGRTGNDEQPAGTYARRVLERLLIDLSWNSSRLEGNTYSLLETEKLLLEDEAAPARNAEERQMVLNHKQAIEYLVEGAQEIRVDERTIRNLHALLAESLLSNAGDAGRIRRTPVDIGGSVYLPLANVQVLEECFRQALHTAVAISDPFEQSFFLLVHLPYLQPFIDGSKRTARLACNIPFIQKNLVPLSFVDVPREPFLLGVLGVYEENRVELLRDVFAFAYERSAARYKAVRESLGAPDPFRLQYRAQLKDAVAELIRSAIRPRAVPAWLRDFAARLPEAARPRFLAIVESELAALHEGNYARYRVTPSEFARWDAAWTAARGPRAE